ncbi:DNA mismatch repair protein MutL, partial [Aquimarina sp. U1-2]|nr:DNA mismatch repair protein MutL [Aquimarina sp. U1-2]
ILSAFEGLLKTGTHPSYFLNLKVNPQTIDINIHPTKTEIKFDDEHTLYAILRSAVKHSLGQFNIAPVLDFERDATLDTPYDLKGTLSKTPRIEVDSNFNPFQDSKTVSSGNSSTQSFKKAPTEHWESLYVGLESKSNDASTDFSEITFESEAQPNVLFDEKDTSETVSSTYQL